MTYWEERNKNRLEYEPYRSNAVGREEVRKGAWRMPRLSEARKDAISCDKLRGSAHTS